MDRNPSSLRSEAGTAAWPTNSWRAWDRSLSSASAVFTASPWRRMASSSNGDVVVNRTVNAG